MTELRFRGVRIRMFLLMGAIALAGGCGSNGSTARDGGDAAPPTCVDHAGLLICQPTGFPFVTIAGATSDACAGSRLGECASPPLSATTASLTQPATGKLCLSGTVASDGYAKIVLVFTTFNLERTKVLKVFNADALGITRTAFTIDSPPSGGITIDAAVVTATDCPASPGDCFTQGFDLMTDSQTSVLKVFTTPGPEVAPLTDFQQTDTGVSQTFDTSALHHLELISGQGQGDYNFCVHDFTFLNAAGEEVKP
jgi:hypothetical protein